MDGNLRPPRGLPEPVSDAVGSWRSCTSSLYCRVDVVSCGRSRGCPDQSLAPDHTVARAVTPVVKLLLVAVTVSAAVRPSTVLTQITAPTVASTFLVPWVETSSEHCCSLGIDFPGHRARSGVYMAETLGGLTNPA